jgi:hypothetical protein
MTRGVDVNGNEDPNGKKFLFAFAAGNAVPNFHRQRTAGPGAHDWDGDEEGEVTGTFISKT